MTVGMTRMEVHIPELRNQFQIAVAEVDPSEKRQRATLGLACVGVDHAAAQEYV